MYYMCSIIVGGCIDFYAIRAFSEVVQRGVGGSARKLGRGLLGVGTAQAPAESTARKELEEQISQSACAMGGGGGCARRGAARLHLPRRFMVKFDAPEPPAARAKAQLIKVCKAAR